MKSAILLFAHGARDPEWAHPFFAIRNLVAQQLPDTLVKLAFLEIMSPVLEVAVAELATQDIRSITLIPLFIARGRHLKEDLPRLLNDICKQHPTIHFHTAPAIGEENTILLCIAQWISAQHIIACSNPDLNY